MSQAEGRTVGEGNESSVKCYNLPNAPIRYSELVPNFYLARILFFLVFHVVDPFNLSDYQITNLGDADFFCCCIGRILSGKLPVS